MPGDPTRMACRKRARGGETARDDGLTIGSLSTVLVQVQTEEPPRNDSDSESNRVSAVSSLEIQHQAAGVMPN